jgi:hypothetical protein
MSLEESPLPLFPLPNVVLFPKVRIPLHIFEPRYRDMVRDAVAGAGRIGMVRLAPGWEDDYEGTPAIMAVGCAGEITRLTELPDGRFTLVLVGTRRFEVLAEVGDESYRQALVRWRAEENAGATGPVAAGRIKRILVALYRVAEARAETGPPSPPPLEGGSFELTVNRLITTSGLDPQAMQELLEIDDLHRRATRLAEVVESRFSAATDANRYRPFLPDDPAVN